jgi:hypothetical protein
VSGETPDVVLNEFGDLSRKARRELEARGIDPDTAVIEYIAATGQIPIITPEMAAAAKAEAQAEAAAAIREVFTASSAVAGVESAQIPPVSVAVIAAETGPIEPLIVSPALDSGSLSSVEQTLAAVSEHTGEVGTSGFDLLVESELSDQFRTPPKGEERRRARKEKKEISIAAKQAKATAKQADNLSRAQEKAQAKKSLDDITRSLEIDQATPHEIVSEAALLTDETKETESHELGAGAVTLSVGDVPEIHEEVIALESDAITPVPDETDTSESETEPQTISEATAAIAIAEAVAAAEAVVEAGEVNFEYGNLSHSVPSTTGSISVIGNALILPTLPESTGSLSPINPTGEIVITESILIPSSVSQVGANLENLDTSEIDIIKDDEEIAPSQSMAPVSAATAVSSYNISNSVVTAPRGMNERLPFILSITAAGLAVGVVALFVAGYFLGMF